MSLKLRRLFRIKEKDIKITRDGVNLYPVVVFDSFERSWDVLVETRFCESSLCVQRTSLVDGWARFCQHHDVNVNDTVVFSLEVVRGTKMAVMVKVNHVSAAQR